MALMQRTRVLWDGWDGSPGYTNLFSRVADTAQHDPDIHAQDVVDLFEGFLPYIPRDVTVMLEREVVYLEDTTGELVGWGQISPSVQIDNESASGRPQYFSAPSGCAIEWGTLAVRNGRRVVGRTFMVPLGISVYEGDGTLGTNFLDAVRPVAEAYADDSVASVLVWSRPRVDRDTGNLLEEGSSHNITSGTIRDQAAVLRTRRN